MYGVSVLPIAVTEQNKQKEFYQVMAVPMLL
jgi:hypothetical protein